MVACRCTAKLALAYADGQWGVPFGSVPTTHIVKPAIPGYEQFDAFEVTCLRAARLLGLSTAQAWLQPLVDGTHAATRLFDALAYNYAIAGTDGHARNFSLLLSGPDVAQAPLYDLNSALPYTRPWGKRFDSVRKLHSSFVLGSTDTWTRVGVADWRAAGEYLGIGGEAAVERVRSIITRVPEAIDAASREVARESGLSVDFDWAAAFSGLHQARAFR